MGTYTSVDDPGDPQSRRITIPMDAGVTTDTRIDTTATRESVNLVPVSGRSPGQRRVRNGMDLYDTLNPTAGTGVSVWLGTPSSTSIDQSEELVVHFQNRATGEILDTFAFLQNTRLGTHSTGGGDIDPGTNPYGP